MSKNSMCHMENSHQQQYKWVNGRSLPKTPLVEDFVTYNGL